jgi:hypothetical protein
MLVVLFFYLNRYTKREYFTVWTTAWLFYALWLTLNLRFPNTPLDGVVFKLKQCCVAISAVFLLWGSLRFLSLPVPQRLFGLFMAFLLVWTFISPLVLTPALDPKMRQMEMQLPVFILLGLGSVFAGVCFYRLRKKCRLWGRACCHWAFCCGAFTSQATRCPSRMNTFTAPVFLWRPCCSFSSPSA